MSETIQYKLPKSLDQITLGQYVAFMSAKTDQARAAIAVGKTIADIEGLTYHAIQTICELFEEVCNQTTATHNGTFVVGEMRLGFIPDFNGITFREHVDLDALAQSVWQSGDQINYQNLPRLMAVLFRPVAERLGVNYRIKPYDAAKVDDYMPYVMRMPMDRVNGAMVFFSSIVNELALSSRAYLVDKLRRKMERILELELEED